MKRLKEEVEERVEKVEVPGVTYYNYLKGKEEFDRSKENLEKQQEEAGKNADKHETSFVALLNKAIKDSGLDLEMQLKESLGVYEYNIKDRKELSKVLESLDKVNIKASIKRGVEEGYRYLLQVKAPLTEAKEENPANKKGLRSTRIKAEKGKGLKEGYIDYEDFSMERDGEQDDEYLVIPASREGYGIDQVEDSACTVGELIERLQDYDLNTKVIIGNDQRGYDWYTYGTIDHVYLVRMEDAKEEEEEFEESKKSCKKGKCLKEDIDLEALEAYANMKEGDNITVTADLLNVLEKALEMAKQYGDKKEVEESCKGKLKEEAFFRVDLFDLNQENGKEYWTNVFDNVLHILRDKYGEYGVRSKSDEELRKIAEECADSTLEHSTNIKDALEETLYYVIEGLEESCKKECKEECEKQLKESNGYGKEFYEVEEKDYYEDMLNDFSWEDEVEYQFPPLSKEDLKRTWGYNIEVLGTVKDDSKEEKDVLIGGKLEDIISYADEELGYCLHPDFVYHKGDFDRELLESIEPVTKEEGIREGKEENLEESKLNEILVTKLQKYVDKVKEELPDAVKEAEERLEASTSKAEDFAALSVFWNKVMDHAFDSWEDQDTSVLVDDAEAMMPMPESVHKQFVNLLFEDKIKNIDVLSDLDIYDDLLTTSDVGLDDGEYEKLYDELVNNVYFEETEEDKEYEPSADDDIEYNGEIEKVEVVDEKPAEEKPAEEKPAVDAEKELEIKKVLEDRNTFEFESGDYCYVGYEDGKLFAGSATNAGIMREVEIDYDFDESVDANLDRLYNAVVDKHPEYSDF